ncbi:formate dehydrogenase accessory protein FdhE [Roseococcus sp.]|uniref:formate dehydrogenase accessory protein FdhE n=1 Tax=Roseococcus sp. TaxID=2109646 RepID=UPI003BABCA4F
MSGMSDLQPDPSMIGRIVKPPFAILPDPAAAFTQRAARFAELAESGELAPYLRFLSGLCTVQAELSASLPPPAPLPPEQVERARAGAMPPLDRKLLEKAPELRDTIARFLEAVSALDMPPAAVEGLVALRVASPEGLDEMIGNVLADAFPFDALPQHLFLSAAVQVHASRLAATLEAERLVAVQVGLCPVCGGPPAGSIVSGRLGTENSRYACCAFCATQWNEVRIKCLACGSTKGIGYKSAEGEENAVIKAETCDSCRSWVKVLYQNRNPSLECIADDVGSLGLDLLMQQTEYRRAGFDPFLIGY